MKKILKVFVLALFVGLAFAQKPADAEKAIFNEDFSKARQILDNYLAEKPKDAYAYFLYGYSYVKEALAGEEDFSAKTSLLNQARGWFQKGLSKKRNDAYNTAGFGMLEIISGNFNKAKEYFDKAVSMKSNDAKLLALIADFYNKSDNPKAIDEATKLLTKAQILDKNNPLIYIKLGDTWKKQRVLQLARQQYEKAVSLDPSNVEAHYSLGKLYLYEKKYNDAAKEFAKAIELDPEFAPAYPELGELFFKIKRYKDAKAYYDKYVKLRPNDLRAKVRYGKFLYLSGEYEKAVEEIGKVLQDTTSPVLQRLLGYSLYESKKYGEAKKAMNKYFTQVSEDKRIAKDYAYYARILAALGENEEAVKYYKKAIEKDPNDIESLRELAKLYRKMKDYDNAIKHFEMLTQKNKSIKDLYALGKLYYADSLYKQADSTFKIIAEMKPDFIYAHLERGRANAAMDPETKEGLAKPHYEKVVELALKDSVKYRSQLKEAYNYLAYYYYNAVEDYPKSKEYYQKILAIDPENKTAKQMVEYLGKLNK